MKCWNQEKCKDCCFQFEPAAAWYKCDYCTRNDEAIEQKEDKFKDMIFLNFYFEKR